MTLAEDYQAEFVRLTRMGECLKARLTQPGCDKVRTTRQLRLLTLAMDRQARKAQQRIPLTPYGGPLRDPCSDE